MTARTTGGVRGYAPVLLPYRPLPWRARLRARRTWLRWAVCLTAPWIVVLALEPALGVADHVTGLAGGAGPLTLGVACWVLGLAGAAGAARRHRALRNELRAWAGPDDDESIIEWATIRSPRFGENRREWRV